MLFGDWGGGKILLKQVAYCSFIISLYAIVIIICMLITVGLQSAWHIIYMPLVKG